MCPAFFSYDASCSVLWPPILLAKSAISVTEDFNLTECLLSHSCLRGFGRSDIWTKPSYKASTRHRGYECLWDDLS